MEPSSTRWTTVADSPHDHEREALAFLRRRLYDRDPYHVWSNFEFVSPKGNLYEVDALAVTDNGVYLIEIKSHPGTIGGDAATWEWLTPQGKRRYFDNPRTLANRKAKALKEVLGCTKAFAKHRNELPYINEIVFLSDPDLTVNLSPPGRHQVFGRDPEPGDELPPERAKIGGIIEALTSLVPDASGRPRRGVDAPLGARIAKAVDQAGIRERTSRRRVNDYQIVRLLDDVEADRDTGVAYQDFLTEKVGLGVRRRLRLYPLEQNATTEQRQAASRAAKREFQHLHRLDHPGILAPREYVEHERGPCLLFDYDEHDQPLDRWLTTPGVRDRLDIVDRLDLVRSVAEALAHAHTRGIYHRALCPSAVWVSEHHDTRTVRLANWHAGARVGTGDATASLTGTAHVDALSGGDAALYRAPEYAQPLADPAALDIFSIGCLAAFAFTGEPPAATPGKLIEQLVTAKHVAVEATGDGVDELVAMFVADLTDADPSRRPATVDDVLAALDAVEEELTLPDPVDEPHIAEARRGTTVADGRFSVLGRIGMGSTAFALLVRDSSLDGRVAVLKVARSPEVNDRLAAEGTALEGLRHPAIVELLDGPLDLDGHAALLLSFAGDKGDTERAVDGGDRAPRTLAARIGESIGAELLQRWGEDLLDAVRYLEQEGVSHRDIKPENLGLAPRGRGDLLRLVLFDFSLAGTPVDRVEAGTQGYLDPFLRARGRWDPAAERYSAAVVLYEMATGAKPLYGDGSADPGLVEAPLMVDAALFEQSVADGLVPFFTKALARDVADRFGTADDMLWAWRAAFRAAAQPATHHPADGGEGGTKDGTVDFTVPPGTTFTTPLAGLPLSNRALNALEREEILTVADLLATPLNRLRGLRGVGTLTRNELRTAVAVLRSTSIEAGKSGDDLALPAAAELLVPRATKANATQRAALRSYVGLTGGGDGWPTQADLARDNEVSRQRMSQVLASARQRWAKQPAVTSVRVWVAAELEATAGLASLDQLADRLALARPTTHGGETDGDATVDDRRAARALVRAALVVESDRAAPRFRHRRLDASAVVVALDGPDGPGANALADHGAALVARTSALLAERPVVPRAELVAALRGIEVPDGAAPLPDAHLAELAASLAPDAAVNSRLELYRRGMAAADAVDAARRALVAVTVATTDELAAKVRARFPDAQPLPDRPALDGLLARAGLDLRWNDLAGRYETPEVQVESSTGSSLSRHATAQPTISVTPVEIDAAADFEDRLRRSVDTGSLLVLATERRYVERVADELARLPVTTVDVDDWLIAEVEHLTAGGKPSWQLVVEADAAGPGSPPWHNLRKLVDSAARAFTDRLAGTPGTVVLTRLGLLARYDRLDLVAAWRDRLHDPATALAGLWLVVVSPATGDVPMIDGHAVPVLTAGEWTRVPPDWLRNAHRTALAPGAS